MPLTYKETILYIQELMILTKNEVEKQENVSQVIKLIDEKFDTQKILFKAKVLSSLKNKESNV